MIHPGNFRVKRHFSIIPHDQNTVELRWGVWNPTSFTLTDETNSGRLYRLIRRLDGSASARTIAREEDVPRSDVEGLIDHLLELGALERGPTNLLDHYLDSCVPGTGATEAAEPATPRVILLGDPSSVNEIGRLLGESLPRAAIQSVPADDPAWRTLTDGDMSWLLDGIAFQERLAAFEPWRGALIVFARRIIHPIQFRALNRVALALGLPWLHAAMDGPFLIIGPAIVPRRSACYECLETRVLMNLREAASYQKYKQAIGDGALIEGAPSPPAALSAVFAAHVALEALNFTLTGSAFTVNKVLTIHLPTMEFSYNEVLRVPNCGACGSSPERDDQALYFDVSAILEAAGD